MATYLIAAGIVFLGISGFFLWAWRGDRRTAALMQSTATSPAADVAKLPAGTLVEVKGTLRCAAPLSSEFTQTPCAHYVATIERDYVTIEYDTTDQRPERKKKIETVQSNIVFAPFEVEDESGRVRVVADRAYVEGVASMEHYEPYQEEKHEGEGFAQKTWRKLTTNEDTVGYRYREMHLPLDIAIYVLGVKSADGSIAAPAEDAKDQSFVISIKSEEERNASLTKSGAWMLRLGILSGIIAAASLAGAYAWSHGQAAQPAPVPEASAPPQAP
jgi:hypothetical protein